MSWQITIHPKAVKQLKKFPKKDSDRIRETLDQFQSSPLAGDIEKMSGEQNVWRRRVGAYRISFELFPNRRTVFVFKIKRRTTTTYK
jgi:mRNA interferase RelE/StbE